MKKISTALALLLGFAATASAQAPNTVFIEEMTWTEIRDAIQAGKTTVIIPTGGTEANGYHMIAGKHNRIITHNAELMAQRLGNALVAPTVQYVPQGDVNRPGFRPGVLSLPSPDFDLLLDAAARSLAAHGFTDILFIGDSGGNQGGQNNVASALNQEWQGKPTRVYALTDYYGRGKDEYNAWMTAQFGYDLETIGSHAGISDTSGMLWVYPEGIRTHKIVPWGGGQEAGVTGDPSKASAEIGRMGMEFKVNAAISQFRALKAPPARRNTAANGG